MNAERVDVERDNLARNRFDFTARHHPHGPCRCLRRIVDDCTRLATRDEAAVSTVGAVDKALVGDTEACCTGLLRQRRIRQRDFMLLDTLDEYYAAFYRDMRPAYREWRKINYEESVELNKLQRSARNRMAMGAAALVAGAAGTVKSDSSAGQVVSAGTALGGAAVFASGVKKRQQADIHVEALHELNSSFEADMTPKVIELEDRTVTLTGSAEIQYEQSLTHQLSTDALTRIFNRQHFTNLALKEIAYARRRNQTVGMIIIDTNNFKSVIDTYGRMIGDLVLVQLTDLILRTNKLKICWAAMVIRNLLFCHTEKLTKRVSTGNANA